MPKPTTPPDCTGLPYKQRVETLTAWGKALKGARGQYTVVCRTTGEQSGSPSMTFPVKIIDNKVAFGRAQLCITPVGGSGKWWIYADSKNFNLD